MTIKEPRMDEFVELYATHHKHLYRYLASLLPTAVDVDDVLQETCVVLWREFESFESGTNFWAWSSRVAFNQVRAWRSRQKRERLLFSEGFLEAVSNELVVNRDQYVERDIAMNQCLKQLPAEHRTMLKQRYMDEQSIESLAEQFERTTTAVYRLLSRIRHALHECISRRLATGAKTS